MERSKTWIKPNNQEEREHKKNGFSKTVLDNYRDSRESAHGMHLTNILEGAQEQYDEPTTHLQSKLEALKKVFLQAAETHLQPGVQPVRDYNISEGTHQKIEQRQEAHNRRDIHQIDQLNKSIAQDIKEDRKAQKFSNLEPKTFAWHQHGKEGLYPHAHETEGHARKHNHF